ncbi:translation initiation factor eIF 4e-like domain-containing protein [Cytidiella melzeri]|nr:translation initiation factor eIF 4e-like domain-containing protein [Cytidiella melzeri]
MAGYFSNHSQPRLLSTANSSSNTASAQSPATPPQNPTTSGRARAPSSRHFSTSLSGSGDEKSSSKEKGPGNGMSIGTAGVHPLRNTWVFWYRQQRAPGNKITNYEEGIKKVAEFSSVESFWSLWTHLNSPSSLLPTTDYLLFHKGVRRPVWEDPLNLSGGKWIIRLRKGVADRLWEDLVLAVIGDQFADCDVEPSGDEADGKNGSASEWPQLCGCTISVRQNEDIITVWNRVEGDAKLKDKINQTIRRVMSLPGTTNMEYKSNNDSMQDKSSFRVAAPGEKDRTPLS